MVITALRLIAFRCFPTSNRFLTVLLPVLRCLRFFDVLRCSSMFIRRDAEYIDKIGETRQQLYDLILAANYMDIKSLLHLGCAKVASLIKGQPLEKIKEILDPNQGAKPAADAKMSDSKDAKSAGAGSGSGAAAGSAAAGSSGSGAAAAAAAASSSSSSSSAAASASASGGKKK
jgi:hypothetical protein